MWPFRNLHFSGSGAKPQSLAYISAEEVEKALEKLCRPPFTPDEFQKIGHLLMQLDLASGRQQRDLSNWHYRPRTYTVLRNVDSIRYAEYMNKFVSVNGYTDLHLPFDNRTLPSFLSDQGCRENFLEFQKQVLTEARHLEFEGGGHLLIDGSADAHFKSMEFLGQGGFGVVDKVWSKLSLDMFARKRVPRRRDSPANLRRQNDLIKEVEILKKLSHRHLVTYIGSYTDNDFIAYLMRPIADWNLLDYLVFLGASPLERERRRAQRFYGCLASAIHYLHVEENIRHTDITTRNVLIYQDKIYLSDFGTATDFSLTGKSTTNDRKPVSIEYIAPEVAHRRTRNSASDMWSLGVVFLEITTVLLGKDLLSFQAFMAKHAKDKDHPQSVWANLPTAIAWLSKIMSPRMASANEAITWVKNLLQDKPTNRPTAKDLMVDILQSPSFKDFCCVDCWPEFEHGKFEYWTPSQLGSFNETTKHATASELSARVAAIFEPQPPPVPMDAAQSQSIEGWITESTSATAMPDSNLHTSFLAPPLARSISRKSSSESMAGSTASYTTATLTDERPMHLRPYAMPGSFPEEEAGINSGHGYLVENDSDAEEEEPKEENHVQVAQGFLIEEDSAGSENGSGSEIDSFDMTIAPGSPTVPPTTPPSCTETGVLHEEDCTPVPSKSQLDTLDGDEDEYEEPCVNHLVSSAADFVDDTALVLTNGNTPYNGVPVVSDKRMVLYQPKPAETLSEDTSSSGLSQRLESGGVSLQAPKLDTLLEAFDRPDTPPATPPLSDHGNTDVTIELHNENYQESHSTTKDESPDQTLTVESSDSLNVQMPEPVAGSVSDNTPIPVIDGEPDAVSVPVVDGEPDTVQSDASDEYATAQSASTESAPAEPVPTDIALSQEHALEEPKPLPSTDREPTVSNGPSIADPILETLARSRKPQKFKTVRFGPTNISTISDDSTAELATNSRAYRQAIAEKLSHDLEVASSQRKKESVDRQAVAEKLTRAFEVASDQRRKESAEPEDSRVAKLSEQNLRKFQEQAGSRHPPAAPPARVYSAPARAYSNTSAPKAPSITPIATLWGTKRQQSGRFPIPAPPTIRKPPEPRPPAPPPPPSPPVREKRIPKPAPSPTLFMEDARKAGQRAQSIPTTAMTSRTRAALAGYNLNRWVDHTNKLLEHYCARGQAGAVRALLSQKCNPGTRTKPRPAPLLNAIRGASPRHAKCVRLLIEHDVNVNTVGGRLDSTPLHLAVDTAPHPGYVGVVHDLVFAGADPNARDGTGECALEKVFKGSGEAGGGGGGGGGGLDKSRLDALALLLLSEAGAGGTDVNVRLQGTRDTPLHLAVRRRSPMAVAMLLHKRADVNAVNAVGMTPLLVAALSWRRGGGLAPEDEQILELLMREEGIKVDCFAGGSRRTALHHAVVAGISLAVEILLEKGANPRKRDADGKTALGLVAMGRVEETREDGVIRELLGEAVGKLG